MFVEFHDRMFKSIFLQILNHQKNIFLIIGPHASEYFQVANYGIGGQYNIHLDPHDFYSTQNDGELQRQGSNYF